MRGLDRKIDIERRTETQDDYGQPVEQWTKVATRRSAKVIPVSADERFTAEQFIARQQTEFRVRWSSALADLNPLDRIIYPSSTDVDSPGQEPKIYDIIEVAELGRRDALKIVAARRAEV